MALLMGDLKSNSFNERAGRTLRDCAELLRRQNANPFRVNAYVRAAQTLESLSTDVRDILRDDGVDGLMQLPAIGRGLAASIAEIARTGRLSQVDRLRDSADPEAVFQTVPGIGPLLAHEIHDSLQAETLEALEVAAHDGRLVNVRGIGPRRAEAVRSSLAALLGRARAGRPMVANAPSIELLLDVDREYRDRVAGDSLPKIAPKRFNPEGRAWLPILHTDRQGWHFTALFSNTARAHELHRTNDWVVLYFYDDDHREGQNTIVTETYGPLKGERVVRGREAECRRSLPARRNS
jgi:putative hydrolase